MDEQLKHRIGKALGRITSGVFIITARDGSEHAAMLASWVQQAAFDPPAVSIALAKDRPIVPLIKASGRVCVSVVPETDKTLMKRYARGVKPGEDPFVGVATATSPGGLTILSDALAWLEARVITVCEFGADHDLLVAEVVDGELLRDERAFAHQRGNGIHY